MTIPDISILTTVHNIPDNLLRLSLTSSVSQAVPNKEIIVVADDTTESNMAVLEEFKSYYPDIIKLIVNDTCRGNGSSLNIALAHARGQYVGIVDGDDATDLNFFSALLAKAKSTGQPVVKGNVAVYAGPQSRKNLDICDEVSKHHYKFTWQFWSAIYDKLWLEVKGINWYPGNVKNNDTFFLYKVAAHLDKLVVVPEVYYHYTRRDGSLDSDKLSAEKIYSCIPVRLEIENYLYNHRHTLAKDHVVWGLTENISRLIIEGTRSEDLEAYDASAHGVVSLMEELYRLVAGNIAGMALLDGVVASLVKRFPGINKNRLTDFPYIGIFIKDLDYIYAV